MDDFSVEVQIGDSTEKHRPGCACQFCEYSRAELRRQRRESIDRSVVRGPNGCWEWTRGLTQDGYGRVSWAGASQLAHRAVYELLVGPIPDTLQIDHKCRNRACVNPDHLHPVTSKLNNENREPTSERGSRNVYWVESRKRWCVTVTHNGRTHWGGAFIEHSDAEQAAIGLRNELFTNNLADRS